jgi:hypothetical protein
MEAADKKDRALKSALSILKASPVRFKQLEEEISAALQPLERIENGNTN